MQSDIMTLAEVADYLKVGEKTITRMVQRQELPGVKVGNQWRFLRSVIDDWLMSRLQTSDEDDRAVLIEQDDNPPVSRLLSPLLVDLEIEPGPKPAILRQLVNCLVRQEIIESEDAETYVDRLMHRELMVSTAVGNGIAFPHVRHPHQNPAEGPLVVLGRCSEGADYDAPDGEPVYLFFLVCSRSEVSHVRILRSLARLLPSSRLISRCLRANTPDKLISAFIRREQSLINRQK